MAGLRPLPVEGFGGLNTTDDSSDVGWAAAVDAENVEMAADGMVRVRDGVVQVGTGAVNTGEIDRILPASYSSGTYVLIVAGWNTTTTYLSSVASDGTDTAIGNWAGSIPTAMVNIGTATSTLTFVATSVATMRKYDGTTLSTSVGTPRFLGVTPTSNRLVQARFGSAASSPTGANGSDSAVFFSDPGAPETFGANNYVTLRPGDGEFIQGVVSWGDSLFVFKDSNAFVFYGESTSATGTPVFNYRRIPLPSPLLLTGTGGKGWDSVAAGRRGVYAWTIDGLFVCTGGQFTRVSRAVDADLTATTKSTFQGLSCAGGRVFLAIGAGGTADRVYVLDEDTGVWTKWNLWGVAYENGVGYSGFVEWPTVYSDNRTVLFAGGSGGSELFRTSRSATDDNGGAIAAYYESGYQAPAGPGVEVTIRETQLTGTGSPKFAWSGDYESFDTASTVTLGTSPAVARGHHRVAKRGESLAFRISSTSGAWSVRRVVPMLRDSREAGSST